MSKWIIGFIWVSNPCLFFRISDIFATKAHFFEKRLNNNEGTGTLFWHVFSFEIT